MTVQLTTDELEERARALALNESGVYGADLEGGVAAIAFAVLAAGAVDDLTEEVAWIATCG